jgi:hypothetical protein
LEREDVTGGQAKAWPLSFEKSFFGNVLRLSKEISASGFVTFYYQRRLQGYLPRTSSGHRERSFLDPVSYRIFIAESSVTTGPFLIARD